MHPLHCYHSDLLKNKANSITPPDKTFQCFAFIQVQAWAHLPSPQSFYNLSSTCIAKIVSSKAHCVKCYGPGTLQSELQILTHLIFVSTLWDRDHYLYVHFFTDEEIKVHGGNALPRVTPGAGCTQPIWLWGCMSACPTLFPSGNEQLWFTIGLPPTVPWLHPMHMSVFLLHPFPSASFSGSYFIQLWSSLGYHCTLYLSLFNLYILMKLLFSCLCPLLE